MPVIKMKHIVSCSSEDEEFPSKNILMGKKWKSATEGEQQISVVIQLEMNSLLNSIDIGNECSAFVEVQVGRLGMDISEFKSIMPSSSFMSPIESRNSVNTNRVRMFGLDKLNVKIAAEQWDQVKLICSQPFNKHVKFGLSFVTLNAKESARSEELGNFRLLDDTNKSNKLTAGSLFAKRKVQESPSFSGNEKISAAAELRSPATLSAFANDQQRNSFCPVKKAKYETAQQNLKRDKLPLRKQLPGESPPKKADLEIKYEKETKKAKTDSVPMKNLFQNVVFTISGLQNPLRSEVRQKGLAMGAKYRPDWDISCTHLICAFVNTPKFSQVKAVNGKIVTKEWILHSYRDRIQHPWRQFRLDPSEEDPHSNDEKTPDMDTDDEIEAILKAENNCEDDDAAVYDADTDIDDEAAVRMNTSNLELPVLPHWFERLNFHIYGEVDEAIEADLICAGATIMPYMEPVVDYVITSKKWDLNFDDALQVNPKLKFVSPNFIQKCKQQGQIVSPTKFLIPKPSCL